MKVVFLSAVVAVVALTTNAEALTYNWSYESTHGTNSQGLVTGTISGLQIGSNDGTGVTIEVLTSPSGNVLGGGWTFLGTGLGGDAFTVGADKTVTFTDAQFRRDSNNDWLDFGGHGSFGTELFSGNEEDCAGCGYTQHSLHGPANFELATVPLPAGLPLILAGLGSLLWLNRKKN